MAKPHLFLEHPDPHVPTCVVCGLPKSNAVHSAAPKPMRRKHTPRG